MDEVRCPCGGEIIDIRGPYGTFLGCDRYSETGCPTKLTQANIRRFLRDLAKQDPEAILEALGGIEGVLELAMECRTPQYVWRRLRPELAMQCLWRYGVRRRK